jgi:hypothetical protein
MSDKAAGHFEGQDQAIEGESQGQKRSITLTITLHPDGQLEMSGPLGNKVLANGLLSAGLQELHRLYIMDELKKLTSASNGRGMGALKEMLQRRK